MAGLDSAFDLALQPDAQRLTWARFLDDVAERHGDRVALRWQSEEAGPWMSLSYAALRHEARALAGALIGAGVVKGARVAVWLPNRPEWVVASFAVALVGGVLVPVNTYATPSERDYILRHSDASLLLMQRRLLKHEFLDDLVDQHVEIAQGRPGRIYCSALPQLRRVACLELEAAQGAVEPWSALTERSRDVPERLIDETRAEVMPSDDGFLIYTSGTTAHPKGVLHMQRAAVIQSWRFAELMALSREDRVLSAQPFFWTAGIAMSLGAALAAGASLILEPVFSAERFLSLVQSERVTTLHAWPHQEKAMAEHAQAKTCDLSSLEKIERSSPLAARAGLETDDWGTYGSYGLSETFTLSAALPASAPAALRRDTSGRPLPGMQLRIVDPDSGAPSSGGAPLSPDDDGSARSGKGEIAVKGATFMRGYYKVDPERYLDAEGYFRTQDGGWFDENGLLHWSGRLSNLIKTGGANVSPLEIERALDACAGVSLAQAVGVAHPVLGEVIVLCVVRTRDSDLDEATLCAYLRERVAAYKVPRRVLFFERDALSFTANQKVQVGPLRELALARLAEEGAQIEGVRYGS